MIEILSDREIELMRQAGLRAATTLDRVAALIVPGKMTLEIDAFVKQDCELQECIPAPLNYRGSDGTMPPFPGACCTSVNNVICHGIPGIYSLKNGDIINVDVTHIYMGYHGDTSRTFMVGDVTDEARRLVETCQEALALGIAQVGPDARLGDIGDAIQKHAETNGFSVVTSFVGHGIGRKFHTEPSVLHVGRRGTGIRLRPGMCFTIEPMLNAGGPRVQIQPDRWTATTLDGSLSAQFEHTVLVTSTGHEVLTQITPTV